MVGVARSFERTPKRVAADSTHGSCAHRVKIGIQKSVQTWAFFWLLLQTLRGPQIVVVVVYYFDLTVSRRAHLLAGIRVPVVVKRKRVARSLCVLACVHCRLVHETAVGVEDVEVLFVLWSCYLQLLGRNSVLVFRVLDKLLEKADFLTVLGGMRALKHIRLFIRGLVQFALGQLQHVLEILQWLL